MTWLEFFAQVAWKATVLLAAGFAAGAMLRRSAASLRHFVWTAILAALLFLPVLIAVAPKWSLRTAPVQTVTVTVRQVDAPIHRVPEQPPNRLLVLWPLFFWTAGFAASAVHFLMGASRTSRMVRGATSWPGASEIPVPVLVSAQVPMPLVWGVRRPVVVLPAEAFGWPADRLRTVLLHEWLHVERRDLWAQAVCQAVCCLYWFHPLAWLAARQLRRERERACDDAVLLRGIAAPDYAAHLVDLVRSMSAREAQWTGAAGMAERSDLESRVRALLDRQRARQPLSRGMAALVLGAAIAVLLPLGSLTSYAQATNGGLAGVVRDPSGTAVSRCEVHARNLDGTNEETARCNESGEYRFGSIPPGRYALEFNARGFAVQKVEVAVSAGTVAKVDSNLEIGTVNQVMTVTGRQIAAAPVNRAAPPRAAVSGNVQQSRLIQQVGAHYPDDARQQGVEGTVKIRAIISKDGVLLQPHVINTDIDPRLAKAALDAVSQWRYEPTLLNGQPVESLVKIDIEFKLNP